MSTIAIEVISYNLDIVLPVVLVTVVSRFIPLFCPCSSGLLLWHWSSGPLTRYVKNGFSMRRECRESFSLHRFQTKPLVSDPDMHHGTCATHELWCMSESLTCGGGENVPGIPGACAAGNFMYLARGPLNDYPSTIKVVLKDARKIGPTQQQHNAAQRGPCVYSWDIFYFMLNDLVDLTNSYLEKYDSQC